MTTARSQESAREILQEFFLDEPATLDTKTGHHEMAESHNTAFTVHQRAGQIRRWTG
jgi:hypothetical protein